MLPFLFEAAINVNRPVRFIFLVCVLVCFLNHLNQVLTKRSFSEKHPRRKTGIETDSVLNESREMKGRSVSRRRSLHRPPTSPQTLFAEMQVDQQTPTSECPPPHSFMLFVAMMLYCQLPWNIFYRQILYQICILLLIDIYTLY